MASVNIHKYTMNVYTSESSLKVLSWHWLDPQNFHNSARCEFGSFAEVKVIAFRDKINFVIISSICLLLFAQQTSLSFGKHEMCPNFSDLSYKRNKKRSGRILSPFFLLKDSLEKLGKLRRDHFWCGHINFTFTSQSFMFLFWERQSPNRATRGWTLNTDFIRYHRTTCVWILSMSFFLKCMNILMRVYQEEEGKKCRQAARMSLRWEELQFNNSYEWSHGKSAKHLRPAAIYRMIYEFRQNAKFSFSVSFSRSRCPRLCL